jgi:DNA-binding winged helix-turn-helix (wHTH) protein
LAPVASGSFRFDRFRLDPADRQLCCDGAPVALNGRYFDALALMVREPGQLVTKDRFLGEVWRGVPVTDEALTQCIRTLRKQLGDSASSPRFIETVAKHGYRFIAPVETVGADLSPPSPLKARALSPVLWSGAAGAVGGGVAGVFGGLFYGLAAAPAMGAASVLLVLLCINVVLGVLGGAAVGAGAEAGARVRGPRAPLTILGAALGGAVVGAAVKLVGIDAFALLFGASPAGMTGAFEGALLGAAVGIGASVARGRIGVAAGAIAGLAAGVSVHLAGGRLMGGSLELVADAFPTSRLRLDGLGAWFGEPGFGPIARIATAGLEGLVFCGVVTAALVIARERISPRPPV